ncbi:MAG: PspC domain-containing protein [Flavobacteriales bacterium]
MNKTLTINLGGLIFHIDEQAYKSLENYLSEIKSYLKKEEGSAEIIQDIESRIAELFREWKRSEEVIGQNEVDKVQELLGRPEDYLVEERDETEKSFKTETKGVRKLFRDTEHGMIGGVCTGIANYVSVDRMWIRLIAILLLIGIGWIDFGGTTFITYIILWIVVPEAKTTTERLQMKGKPINLENIKESAEELGKNIKNSVQNSESNIRNLGDFIIQVIKIIGKIFLILIGIILLIGVFGLLIAFLASFSGLIFGEFEYFKFFDRIVEYSWQYYLWIMATVIAVISLLTIMIKLGLSLINRRLKWHKGFTIGLITMFFISLFILLSLGLNQASYYSYEYDLEKEYTIPATDSIAIPIKASSFLEENHKGLADYNGFAQMGIEDDYFFDEKDALVYQMKHIDLEVKKSNDDKIHLINQFEASGQNREEAMKNAKVIHYKTQIDSARITLGNQVSIPKNTKKRGQEVRSVLYLPIGQKVLLSSDFYLRGDLVNFDDWNDEEMRTWQMTEEGFVCIDCIQNAINIDDDDFGTYNTGKEVIIINEKGIHISDGNDRVIINNQGINIKSGGKEIIKIDSNIKKKELKELENKIERKLRKKGVKVNIDVD